MKKIMKIGSAVLLSLSLCVPVLAATGGGGSTSGGGTGRCDVIGHSYNSSSIEYFQDSNGYVWCTSTCTRCRTTSTNIVSNQK